MFLLLLLSVETPAKRSFQLKGILRLRGQSSFQSRLHVRQAQEFLNSSEGNPHLMVVGQESGVPILSPRQLLEVGKGHDCRSQLESASQSDKSGKTHRRNQIRQHMVHCLLYSVMEHDSHQNTFLVLARVLNSLLKLFRPAVQLQHFRIGQDFINLVRLGVTKRHAFLVHLFPLLGQLLVDHE